MIRWASLLLLVLAACTSDPHPAPVQGTTYRIRQDVWDKELEMYIDVMTLEKDCRNVVASSDELGMCRPFVDRAAAEVHLAFQLLDRTTLSNYPVAMNDPKRQRV